MLDDIKKTLWATADKLRTNMDAAEYKHLVLGLIFLKYISDTFAARRAEVLARLADPTRPSTSAIGGTAAWKATHAGITATRRKATPTTRGCSTCCIT